MSAGTPETERKRMATPEKTAIITGVSSFVGCHLASAFVAAGYRVVATTSRETGAYDGVRADRLNKVRGVAELAELDIEDGDAVTTFVEKQKPDIWVHHAGFAENYHSPDHDFMRSIAVNVRPLESLYRALEGTGCGVIVTGSSAEYGASENADNEENNCQPDLPYGTAKLMESVEAELLCKIHGVPTRVARLYIPFGPMDNSQKLLSQVVTALAAGKPIDLSPCNQKRDFVSVGDVCNAYLKLAEDMPRQPFDLFNICAGEAVTLKSMLETLADLMNADRNLLKFGAIDMRPGETAISYGDNTKAKTLLGWKPQPLQEALKALT